MSDSVMMTAHTPAPENTSPREPFLRVLWNDEQSTARGYLVIDRLVSGIATGGTRMRAGCTVDEVAALAREMTLKMGAYGIHVGGAKGGIDFDPADPRAAGVRARFLQAVRPFLESYWVTAGDLGTQQGQLDQAFSQMGLGGTSFHAAMLRSPDEPAARARVQEAFSTPLDGLYLSELIGGFGVAEATLAGLEQLGVLPGTATVVLQGFGAMGGSTALYLARAGVKVTGITDARGLILNTERGLDVERMVAARSADGVIDRSALRSDDVEAPGDTWLHQDVDVLVPAAVSYAITTDNCDGIRARLIVEAANLSVTAEAERRLFERGVAVVPDFVANTGAAAGAWWVILGEVTTPAEACDRLSAHTRPLVARLMRQAADEQVPLRAAGEQLARRNSQRMSAEHGGVVPAGDLFSPTQRAADVVMS